MRDIWFQSRLDVAVYGAAHRDLVRYKPCSLQAMQSTISLVHFSHIFNMTKNACCGSCDCRLSRTRNVHCFHAKMTIFIVTSKIICLYSKGQSRMHLNRDLTMDRYIWWLCSSTCRTKILNQSVLLIPLMRICQHRSDKVVIDAFHEASQPPMRNLQVTIFCMHFGRSVFMHGSIVVIVSKSS
jgi:hypothetical protein